ncbi:pilin [Patescibacteria group bacterium]|nr:pilin [Patescibacteria group bacterium]MBU1907436.1 pilin [Patescibacteria group bacterium]
MMSKFKIIGLSALLMVLGLPLAAHAQGGFLAGISESCWEQGDCQLDDMLQVFVNVSNFILSIVGSLALLLFVVGGFYMIFSQGEASRTKKGKDFIFGALIGIVIVFGAYGLIYGLESAFKSGTLSGGSGACNADTVGNECGTNMTCIETYDSTGEEAGFYYDCLSKCAQQPGTWECRPASIAENVANYVSGTGLCPNEADICVETYSEDF